MEELLEVFIDNLFHYIPPRTLLFLLLLPGLQAGDRRAELPYLLHQHLPDSLPAVYWYKVGSSDKDRVPHKEEPVLAVQERGGEINKGVCDDFSELHHPHLHLPVGNMPFFLLTILPRTGLQVAVLLASHHHHHRFLPDGAFLPLESPQQELLSLKYSLYYAESNIIFYTLSLVLCYYLCYSRGWGMKGLWVGWIIGLTINSIFSLFLMLNKSDK